ncbi:GntP family permease [Bacillus cereus]|nr:GntP family permease [Bacillus cereus]
MNMYLLMITLLSIVIVILGVSWWRWHAFISLTIASLFLAIMSGVPMDKIVSAYETGVGSVLGHLVGILVLGTILGKMMAESGAGGGFKQILIDSGVGNAIAQMSEHLALSPIVLAFMVAGLIRIATGSATVALTTAAGIVSPIIENTTGVNLELLVIATGAGALMFSHVNDAGFWMVKEYLGLTVKETFKTWTVLETLLSFIAFGGVLLLDMFI